MGSRFKASGLGFSGVRLRVLNARKYAVLRGSGGLVSRSTGAIKPY